MDSGHRVVAVAAPGVATQNAPHGEPRAFEGAVFAQRLDGVLRTGGGVATRRGCVGRDEAAIEADGRDEQQRQPVEQGVHGAEKERKSEGDADHCGADADSGNCKRSATRLSRLNRRLCTVSLFMGSSASQMKARCTSRSAGMCCKRLCFCRR